MSDSSTKKQTLPSDSVGGLTAGSVEGRVGFFTKLSTKINPNSKNGRQFNDFKGGVGFFTKLSTKINQNSKNGRQFNDFQEFDRK